MSGVAYFVAYLLAAFLSQNVLADGVKAPGPGSGNWMHATPESVGLRSDRLREVEQGVRDDIPPRYCWLVARHGKIISEQYYEGTNPLSVHEADSLMKTAVALVMGVAWTKGLFKLDTPLVEYGVRPGHPYNVPEVLKKWYPLLTPRHLLGQVSGMGKFAPGTAFTYSSDGSIQHLERLLAAVTGTNDTVMWATENFAVPLGFASLFITDGEQLSAGGGQLGSCRDIARLGQLLLNKGRWLRDDGTAYQLIAEDYIHEMTRPSNPSVTTSYGFLLWIWSPPPKSFTAYPKWGVSPGCGQETEDTISNDYGFDRTAYVSPGWMAKLLMVFPEDDTLVLSFGNTLVGSSKCDVRFNITQDLDDSYSAFLIFNRLKKALPPPSFNSLPVDTVLEASASPDRSLESTERFLAVHEQLSERPPSQQQVEGLASQPYVPQSGSCTCVCSPDQGYGSCWVAPEGVNSDEGCMAFSEVAAARCTPLGIVQECRISDIAAFEKQRQTTDMAELLDPCWGTEATVGVNFTCHAVRGCAAGTEKADGRSATSAACLCKTNTVTCSYAPDPCVVGDPYTPLVGGPSLKPANRDGEPYSGPFFRLASMSWSSRAQGACSLCAGLMLITSFAYWTRRFSPDIRRERSDEASSHGYNRLL